jgi:hypothetical protein
LKLIKFVDDKMVVIPLTVEDILNLAGVTEPTPIIPKAAASDKFGGWKAGV